MIIAVLCVVCADNDTYDFVDFSSEDVEYIVIRSINGKKITVTEEDDIELIHKMFDHTKIVRSVHPDWDTFPWLGLGGMWEYIFDFYADDGCIYHYTLIESLDLRVVDAYVEDKDGNEKALEFSEVPLSPLIFDFATYMFEIYEPEDIDPYKRGF
ncbi:MAG: hypothetical protein E7218_02465 [Anaerofustis stercorihominis]|nr:hypothetical protein [Anaerofustis stercorihominis]